VRGSSTPRSTGAVRAHKAPRPNAKCREQAGVEVPLSVHPQSRWSVLERSAGGEDPPMWGQKLDVFEVIRRRSASAFTNDRPIRHSMPRQRSDERRTGPVHAVNDQSKGGFIGGSGCPHPCPAHCSRLRAPRSSA